LKETLFSLAHDLMPESLLWIQAWTSARGVRNKEIAVVHESKSVSRIGMYSMKSWKRKTLRRDRWGRLYWLGTNGARDSGNRTAMALEKRQMWKPSA
jgi:hypothetical protein